jgi:hypothetical protein
VEAIGREMRDESKYFKEAIPMFRTEYNSPDSIPIWNARLMFDL